MYDVVIVGGGMAGLYTAYKLISKNPSIKLLIFEKDKIGGRAGNILFENVQVVTGAGVGRFKKDKLLKKLLLDLNFPINTFNSTHSYKTKLINAKRIFKILQNAYLENPVSKTFKEFSLSILNESTYNTFITMSGYTDYEQEDAYTTLFHYGFEDNLEDWTGFYVPWTKLINKLSKIVTIQIKQVIQIRKEKNSFRISLKDGSFVISNKVVLATTIDAVKSLVPVQKRIYSHIKGQPFLRIYAKCSEKSIPYLKSIKGMTIVNGPLQKILPIDQDKGIYMISYSDNQNALDLLPFISDTAGNKRLFSILLEYALSIPHIELESIMGIYWKIGTHYFSPISVNIDEFIYKAQHPLQNMFVVGEMVSKNQGWVEGALESVEKVIDEI